jgi:hypothetical protein
MAALMKPVARSEPRRFKREQMLRQQQPQLQKPASSRLQTFKQTAANDRIEPNSVEKQRDASTESGDLNRARVPF